MPSTKRKKADDEDDFDYVPSDSVIKSGEKLSPRVTRSKQPRINLSPTRSSARVKTKLASAQKVEIAPLPQAEVKVSSKPPEQQVQHSLSQAQAQLPAAPPVNMSPGYPPPGAYWGPPASFYPPMYPSSGLPFPPSPSYFPPFPVHYSQPVLPMVPSQPIQQPLQEKIAQLTAERDQAIRERDQARAEKKQADEEKERAIAEKRQALQESSKALAEKTQADHDRRRAVTLAMQDKDQAIAERDRAISDKGLIEQQLVRLNAQLGEYQKLDKVFKHSPAATSSSYSPGSSHFYRLPGSSGLGSPQTPMDFVNSLNRRGF